MVLHLKKQYRGPGHCNCINTESLCQLCLSITNKFAVSIIHQFWYCKRRESGFHPFELFGGCLKSEVFKNLKPLKPPDIVSLIFKAKELISTGAKRHASNICTPAFCNHIFISLKLFCILANTALNYGFVKIASKCWILKDLYLSLSYLISFNIP